MKLFAREELGLLPGKIWLVCKLIGGLSCNLNLGFVLVNLDSVFLDAAYVDIMGD